MLIENQRYDTKQNEVRSDGSRFGVHCGSGNYGGNFDENIEHSL
jgi:hypothetical protein